MQDGLTALHIACNKGMPGVVSRLLLTAKEQKRFCQKKGSKKNSDCEDVINAKERPHVRICKCCVLQVCVLSSSPVGVDSADVCSEKW